jgi:hypothetical protein
MYYTTQHKWRTVLVVFVTSGRPSVITFERRSRWTDFRESCYWILLRKSVDKQLIWLKSDNNIGHCAWRPNYVLCCWLQHVVVGQQRKGSRMSRCHGSIERIYIADSCRQVKSDTEGTYCFVSLATFSGFMLLTATCRSRATQRERIVAFHWQRSAVLYCWQLHQLYVGQERRRGNVLLRFTTFGGFMLLIATYMSTAKQRECIVAFYWQHSAVLYCWQLHVGQERYRGNVLLRFIGNIQRFYIVDSYLYVNSKTEGVYCCVYLTSDYENVPQCHVTRTLPVSFLLLS